MKINVMSKSESELLTKQTSTFSSPKTTIITTKTCLYNNSTQTNGCTIFNRISKPHSIGHIGLVNSYTNAELVAARPSSLLVQRLSYSRKMKRKRKIPEISWLIAAICLNCYVIISAKASANSTTSTITNQFSSPRSGFSSLAWTSTLTSSLSSLETTISPLQLSHTKLTNTTSMSLSSSSTTSLTPALYVSPFTKRVSTTSTITTIPDNNLLRPKRATHSSPDGRHIDVDVDNDGLDDDDMADIHSHLHHGDLVDSDDMYLHNLDNIGYHHDGTGLLPHELPEHDHIAHHLGK